MQPKFSADEKVLCFHGPLLYEAKILRSKKEGGTYMYFVHYQGWNKNWDEWVTEPRMLKQVAENFEKQKKLLATHMAQTKANKQAKKVEKSKKVKGGSDSGSNSRASTPVSDRPAGRPPKRSLADDEVSTSSRDDDVSNPPSTPVTTKESSRKKGRREESVEDLCGTILTDDVIDNKYVIDIPEELKYVLINDWDLVVHQKHLFKVPAKVTVSNIIEQYVMHLASQEICPARRSVATEVIKGLGEYFNVSVGPQLCYGIEKLQYKEDCESAGAVQPVDIYGSAHLLRLMVKIGGYLSCSNYQEPNCKVIEEHIDDFLTYLDMNRSMFFTSKNYSPATQEYLAKSGSK